MSGHRESLSSVTPDQKRIPCKNKRNKTSDTLITRKKTIQEPVNPSKSEKYDTITDVEKIFQKKELHCFGIRYTTKVVLIRRIVVPTIHQVKLMVV